MICLLDVRDITGQKTPKLNADRKLTVLPTKHNNLAGLEGEGQTRYVKEAGWLWNVLTSSFQESQQGEFLKRTLQPFQTGLYNGETAVGAKGDGVLGLWCTMSMTRPTDEQHREEVEEWPNQSYMQLYKNNVLWDMTLKDIRAKVTEAKELDLRIKWMNTGKKYIQALANMQGVLLRLI